MKNLKKLDLINYTAIAATVLGLIITIIGGAVLSSTTLIGFNFNLSPVLFVGIAIILLALVAGIVGSVLTEKKQLNKVVSTLALYLPTIALMFALVFVVLVIVWPVLHPVNG